MPRTAAKSLTSMKVEKLSKPGAYADGGNLYLQITPNGTKSWLLRYMRDGKARKMGLGPFPLVTLAMAREKAIDARRKLLDDIDPIDQRREQRLARRAAHAKAITFRQASEKYVESHRAGWKSAKHASQWGNTLDAHVHPVFGDLSVDAIDVGLVLKALEPIWTTKPETASRVRGRIESVLDWATARKLRSGENPARWRGHLDNLLPARNKLAKVTHFASLPYSEIGDFLAGVRALEGVSPRALEFTILTASRTNEALKAKWDEFDLAARLWTIPPERMKAGIEHRVPLSDWALEILEGLPREDSNPHVFIGQRAKSLSTMALLLVLRRMKRDDVTVHGFRACFKTWCSEQTSYPSEIVEMSLAHAVGSKVEQSYRRTDLLEKRRRLLRDWSDYCEKPSPRADNVSPMRRAK